MLLLSTYGYVNITATDPSVVWIGRVLRDETAGFVTADWEGVEARLQVANGTTRLRALISEGNPGGQRYNVWINSTATGYKAIRVTSFWVPPSTGWWEVISGYSLQYDCEVRIQRSVEPIFANIYAGANTQFLAFSSDMGFAPAPARKARRIEFLGDSITACLGNLGDYSAGCWASAFTQDFGQGYAQALCTAFDAECSTLAWSGISMYNRGTGPSYAWCPTGKCSLPDLYWWALPTLPGQNPWNFSQWVPQAVHINLGTNDNGNGLFNNATFVAGFESTYISFIHNISAAYADEYSKDIHYFLVYQGPMSTVYNASVLEVAANLTADGYKVTPLDYMITPYSPIGCEYHPSVPVHQAMAAKAQPIIAQAMGWD